MNYRKTTNLGSRTISFFLAFLLLFSLIAPIMNTSYAGESAVIKPLIDSMNGGYVASVELEDGKHEEVKYINLSSFSGKTGKEMVIAGTGWSNMANTYGTHFKTNIIGNDINSTLGSSYENTLDKNIFLDVLGLAHPYLGWPADNTDAKTVDSREAARVTTELTRTLNTLISYIIEPKVGNNAANREYNIKATIDASYWLDPSIKGTTITGIKNIPNITIYYGTYDSNVIKIGDFEVPAFDMDSGDLYCYVIDSNKKMEQNELEASKMIWAMPKGYVPIAYSGKQLNEVIRQNPSDIPVVSCFMIAQYANQIYRIEGAHTQSNTTNEDVNFLLKMIYGIFDGLLSGLENLLGLYNMDELIFNEGTRGGIGFEDGLMHSTWWSIVLKYFTIFQVIAWMAIAIAIVKSLVQVNLGTISSNSTQRAQLMDTLVKLVTVGLLLTLCIPIIRLLVQVNNAVVDIFAASYSGDMAKMPYSPNILVGLVMMFFSFMMSFYTNFIYIMRSITLAILIAMGPFFIVTMAFSKKNLFESWLKEVVANIFLQSFHAFAFSFLFEAVVAGGGTVERIAVIFAIYPLTDFFRSMVFGSAGNFAVSTGKQLGNMAKNLTTSAVGAAAGAGMGLVGGAILNKAGGSLGTATGEAAKAATGGGTGIGSGGGGRRGGTQSAGDGLKTVGKAANENGDIYEKTGNAGGENGSQNARNWAKAANALGTASNIVSTGMRTMNGMMEGVAMGNSQLATNSAKELGGAMGAGAVNSVGNQVKAHNESAEKIRKEQVSKNRTAIKGLTSEQQDEVGKNGGALMNSAQFKSLNEGTQQALRDKGFSPVAGGKLNAAQMNAAKFRGTMDRVNRAEERKRLNDGPGSYTADDLINLKTKSNFGQMGF